jgi:pSer/pThr/pTyr-binding forkhead associated (FHA) protein
VTAAAARLVWERPDGTTVDFPLADRPLLVGRDEDADIRVQEALVSRAHARIEPRPSGYAVLDLGSTNLTRVNGEVVGERMLADGDEIRFGRAVCRFHDGSPGATAVVDPVANGV